MRRLFYIGLSSLARIAAIDRAARAAKGVAMASVLFMTAGMLATAAFACLMASLWIYSIGHVGPAGAPLIVAAVLALGSTAIILACMLARPARSHKVRDAIRAAEGVTFDPPRMISAAATGFLTGLSGRASRHE